MPSVTDNCERGDRTTRGRAVPPLGTVWGVPCAARPSRALRHVTFSGARRSGTCPWPQPSTQRPSLPPAPAPRRIRTGRAVRRRGARDREGGHRKVKCGEADRAWQSEEGAGYRCRGAWELRGPKGPSCPGLAPASPTHLDGLGRPRESQLWVLLPAAQG